MCRLIYQPTFSSLPSPQTLAGGPAAKSRRAALTGSRLMRPRASGGVVRRSRSGRSVSALAKDLGVSFDWGAQHVIAAGVGRDRPVQRGRRPTAELDSDDGSASSWLVAPAFETSARRLKSPRRRIAAHSAIS